MRIVCGKYDNLIDLSICCLIDPKRKIRVGSLNPNKLKRQTFTLISTDGNIILHKGVRLDKRNYLSRASKLVNTELMVLTRKERDFLIDDSLNFDVEIAVFEHRFPIFSHIRYVSNPERNLQELERLIDQIQKLDIQGRSLAQYFSTQNQYAIERKLRFKNRLDRFFSFGLHGGYQEVFKLREEREDRAIVAFDFNSMYASCMEGVFSKPSAVRYKRIESIYHDDEPLDTGMYRVVLKQCTNDFFSKYHPFLYVKHYRRLKFKLDPEDEVELLLFDNEVKHYSNFFQETYVIEGLSSKDTINHPLYRRSKKYFEQRQNAAKQNNLTMERLYKFRLVTLHSASNPRRSRRKIFNRLEDLNKYVLKNFMVHFRGSESVNRLNKLKGFGVAETTQCFYTIFPQLDDSKSVFSLSARVLANSRLKMTKTIKAFEEFPSVEICYANIDSIHISINKDQIDQFLATFQEMISDRLGDLKIQTIAGFRNIGLMSAVTGYLRMVRWYSLKTLFLITHQPKIHFYEIVLLKYICKDRLFSYVKVCQSSH